jgi:LPXTG-motif cell wall-anchored protein
MRRVIFAAALIVSAFPAGFALAGAPDWPPPKPAPAPEMGGSLLGLAMAGALAFYVVRRRRTEAQG